MESGCCHTRVTDGPPNCEAFRREQFASLGKTTFLPGRGLPGAGRIRATSSNSHPPTSPFQKEKQVGVMESGCCHTRAMDGPPNCEAFRREQFASLGKTTFLPGRGLPGAGRIRATSSNSHPPTSPFQKEKQVGVMESGCCHTRAMDGPPNCEAFRREQFASLGKTTFLSGRGLPGAGRIRATSSNSHPPTLPFQKEKRVGVMENGSCHTRAMDGSAN